MATGMGPTATIGQSIQIKGELTGSEDLTIEGKVEGKIELKDQSLIIGPNGSIKADIMAKNITIAGEVVGNLTAEEKVEIKDSGRLNGNITAPRIAIADGAFFKGSVEMEKKAASAVKERAREEGMRPQPQPHVVMAGNNHK
jgi:cytoskeletal protein CcmA (bactofilin family)